jgi:4'-phosphopantetheinyl transferase EntD
MPSGSLVDSYRNWEDQTFGVLVRQGLSRLVRLAADFWRRWALPRCSNNAQAGPRRSPPGYVGSIAHDSAFAVVALASHPDVAAVGIDIEPATRLPSECFETIATPLERVSIRDLVEARLLFCAKEAVFKAVNAEGGTWLEHTDVEVDIDSETAIADCTVPLELRLSRGPTLLALAVLLRGAPQYF